MTETVLLRHIADHHDAEVRVKGWVIHARPTGKLVFFEMRDGTGSIQCVVFNGDVSPDVFGDAKALTLETSVEVVGVVRRDGRAKYGYEIAVRGLRVLQQPFEDFPISEKEHGIAFLIENRHLWLRASRQVAIQRIRANVVKYARDILEQEDFSEFFAPVLTPVACEGTTTLFKTEYFTESAYLTQSGQLYAEAGALALRRVYTCGPVFRAEKSKTRRHLTEFWMIEPEAAFFELDDVMRLAERFIAAIIERIVANNQQELRELGRDIGRLSAITAPFPRLSYDEAIRILHDRHIEISWGDDFGAEHETVISQQFDRPVMIHRYPATCKAFYMKQDTERPDLALCVDMIAPEGYGEIIGGGQREDVYETLVAKIDAHGLRREDFAWYLDLRKYGSVPHAGFGLGIERFVAWVCGLHHVRETIPFPRMLERIYP